MRRLWHDWVVVALRRRLGHVTLRAQFAFAQPLSDPPARST